MAVTKEMLTLGIETAGKRAGVALFEGEELLVVRSGAGPHSAVLLPMIAEMLASHDRRPGELALIGVARGPGAYTGLRVGVVTAKLLGRATGAVVLGVPTLGAMAAQAPAEATRVLVALHAYKRRLLWTWFDRDRSGALLQSSEPRLTLATAVEAAGPGEAVITDSPELLVDLDRWGAEVPATDSAAEAVARLARARLTTGADDESLELTPRYLKPPAITVKPGNPNDDRRSPR